jgi:geranylgeranyl diphosphate synthase type I
MLAYFNSTRDRISRLLASFLSKKRPQLAIVNSLGPDAADRLLDFALQGKMLRGCLVALGYALACREGVPSTPEVAIAAGAAMELFQSGLLVHDDIMDRDVTRRGKATLSSQYAELAALEGSADPVHSGVALGICAGDVAYFLAFEILASLEASPAALRQVIALAARELTAVGVAQMQDVAWGSSHGAVDRADILRMYTFKTSRYTFSLPLMTGGILAGARPHLLDLLETLGETAGNMFQIRDDELGLYGDEEELGKPVGSDVREGKKTLLHSALLAHASEKERQRLERVFGNRESSEADLAFVRELADAYGVKASVDQVARDLEVKARGLIGRIHTGTEADRQALNDLLDYVMARKK